MTISPDLTCAVIALLLTSGVGIGVLAGLFGIGGGALMVPLLQTLFLRAGCDANTAIHVAVATSLATILPTSLASFRAHARHGAIDWTILKRWLPMLALGALAGSLITSHLNARPLHIAFAILMLIVLWQFMRRDATQNESADTAMRRLPESWNIPVALGIGLSSSMLGVGGGALGVPALHAAGLPLRRAIGSASSFGWVIALPALFAYLLATPPMSPPYGQSWGLVQPIVLLLLLPGGIVGTKLGAWAAHHLPVTRIRVAFAALIAMLALKMLISAWA